MTDRPVRRSATSRGAAFIAHDRRRAIATGEPIPAAARGTALFADVSGFTPLTERLALELGPQRGAEELSVHLDRVFDAIITDVDAFGGDVLYFSGDAITCWIDGDDGTRACACAQAIQRTMLTVGHIASSRGTETVLGIKVAIAVGDAHRFVVGDPSIQLIDVLAGALIDELADAEHLAEPSDVVLAASAMRSLDGRIRLRELRGEGAGQVGLLEELIGAVPTPTPPPPDPELSGDLVRPWVLPVVFDRLQAGRGEFLSELRPAFPMFVRFGGIDLDDPGAAGVLDDFIRECQGVARRFGGNVIQLTIGDKGAYLYIVFGVPEAHEDDGARAAMAALALLESAGHSPVGDLQIGITHGRICTSEFGHHDRRTFGCLGDAVNLAARLMTSAPVGEIFCSTEMVAAAGERFRFESAGDLVLKGKARPVPAHRLVAAEQPRRTLRSRDVTIVGRGLELAQLDAARETFLGGHSQIIALTGEGGMGKSRLLAEVAYLLDGDGVEVVHGAADAFGRNRSYLIWRGPSRALFGLEDDWSDASQIASLEQTLETVQPGHGRRAPLVGPVVGLTIPDNDLTQSFDAKLRKASLEALLSDALRVRAGFGPVAVLLDDAQWIDDLSIDLLDALVRNAAALPVLFVLAYRESEAAVDDFGLARYDRFHKLAVSELSDGEAGVLVDGRVADLWGPGTVPADAVRAFVVDHARGNPLYLEAILEWMHGRDIDPASAASVASLELPDSLHSLVLSRLDSLGEQPRETLKVASVIGRTFGSPLVQGIDAELGELEEVEAHLEVLDDAELVARGTEDRAWEFRHPITHEVTYESLPFALRAELHGRTGALLEAQADHQPDLDLLVHHYWRSNDRPKQIELLDRAGEAAQARYANATAIDYYQRLCDLVEGNRRADVLLRLGKVQELTGAWDEARSTVELALAFARENDEVVLGAWCDVALAEVDRKQGRFADAQHRLELATSAFARSRSDAGTGQVLHLLGTLAAQQGDYDRAREAYGESFEVRRRLGDEPAMASVLSNLGVVAEYTGDYRGSLEFHHQALDLRNALGDRWAIAVSLTNIGIIAVHEERFDAASITFREALALNEEVGDLWMVAICHNNLGNALRGLGQHDEARREYAEAARAYLEYDDQWALAFLYEDVALLAAALHEPVVALELLGAADGAREAVGSPRAPALEASLTEKLDADASAISPGDRAAAHARGRLFGADRGVVAVMSICADD